MERKGSSLLRIFRHFWNSFGAPNSILKGEDHLGNKYYERLADERRNRKGWRYVKPFHRQTKVDSELEIPTEWNAWLRHSRKTPPSLQEIEHNYMSMMKTRQRALEVETREEEEKLSLEANSEISTNLDASKLLEKQPHPDFEDMELKSGSTRKLDYKDKEAPIDRTVS
ncbi:Mimitin, mitochondrial [Mizuhopecten yessoensis]|uniref:Mimitin, mitochondrial n=2 Tax=Mizuhopecten yessoensis TaxID=6573 RepID=A0A210PNV8_MIZYE|nr:Mimitin, mitochondrial [Mizuhopecten yessoensis]